MSSPRGESNNEGVVAPPPPPPPLPRTMEECLAAYPALRPAIASCPLPFARDECQIDMDDVLVDIAVMAEEGVLRAGTSGQYIVEWARELKSEEEKQQELAALPAPHPFSDYVQRAFSCTLPTSECLEGIGQFIDGRPVLNLCAGKGFWARMLRDIGGVDSIAAVDPFYAADFPELLPEGVDMPRERRAFLDHVAGEEVMAGYAPFGIPVLPSHVFGNNPSDDVSDERVVVLLTDPSMLEDICYALRSARGYLVYVGAPMALLAAMYSASEEQWSKFLRLTRLWDEVACYTALGWASGRFTPHVQILKRNTLEYEW